MDAPQVVLRSATLAASAHEARIASVGSVARRGSARVRASRGRRRSRLGADDDGEGADAGSRPRRVAGRADDARAGRGRLARARACARARAAADGAAAHAMPGGRGALARVRVVRGSTRKGGTETSCHISHPTYPNDWTKPFERRRENRGTRAEDVR